MPETYVFEYLVTDEIIVEAAEAALVATNAGRPPRRLRSVVIAEAFVLVQLLIGLIAGIVFDLPDWIIVTAGAVFVLLGLWTGLVAFTLVMYPWNRRRYLRLIGESYQKLDSPLIRFSLSESGFTVESRPTHRPVPWSGVSQAFVGRTFSILTASKHGQLLLPVSGFPPGAARCVR